MIYYGYKDSVLVKGSFTELMEAGIHPLSVMELTSHLISSGRSVEDVRKEMEEAILFPLQYDEEGRLLA